MKAFSATILCMLLFLAGCQHTPSNTTAAESSTSLQTTENFTHEEESTVESGESTETTSFLPVEGQRFTFSCYLVRDTAKAALGQDYALYCKLVDAYVNHEETISGFSSETQFYSLFSVFQREYYPAEKFAATFKTHDQPFVYSNGTVTLRYQYDRAECDSYIRNFENKINTILSVIEEDDSDVEIIEKLYHHVCTTMTYDKSFSADTMYDYIIYNSGRASIFTEYFELLLRCAGIECLSCYSMDKSNTTIDASWVIAKINGSYYHFDPSWEAQHSPGGWDWFAMSDNARLRSLTTEWFADLFVGINPYVDTRITVPAVDIMRCSPYYDADPFNVPQCTSSYYDERRFGKYSLPSMW